MYSYGIKRPLCAKMKRIVHHNVSTAEQQNVNSDRILLPENKSNRFSQFSFWVIKTMDANAAPPPFPSNAAPPPFGK
jgi:hypothetical protein